MSKKAENFWYNTNVVSINELVGSGHINTEALSKLMQAYADQEVEQALTKHLNILFYKGLMSDAEIKEVDTTKLHQFVENYFNDLKEKPCQD